MTVWLVRAGSYGQRETLALEQGLSITGFGELPDLGPIGSRDALAELIRDTYRDADEVRVSSWADQLWAFRELIEVGDLVVLPLQRQAAIAVGRISGPYVYRPDLPDDCCHTRATSWMSSGIGRSKFDQDLLYAMHVIGTVFRVSADKAEERIAAMVGGKV